MKKIVPDPPADLHRTFDIPAGQSLSTAIFEGLVPIDAVLSNACKSMLHTYADIVQAHESATDPDVRRLLMAGLLNLEVALGQVDALVAALRQVPESGFHGMP
ncbi:hypothetical protein P0Y43_03275 [Pseudomonas entomophila]|uniref:hypothetical protein n=1 Tax=Pseudomonas entomophila TaxID=312306 RepID=UPI0023D8A236|nr:hypothetical protein [Pseudomonas entomophila]MDF0729750.1 hypothetical protein [Pseudomonas entomophila]